LGLIYLNIGNLSEASKFLNSSLSELDKIFRDNSTEGALIHESLGFLGLKERDFQNALDHFKKALEIKNNFTSSKGLLLNENDLIISKNYIALTHLKFWELEKAKTVVVGYCEKFKVSDDIPSFMTPDLAFTYALLGMIKQEEGIYKQSYEYFNCYKYTQQLLNISQEHPNLARAYLYLGEIFEKNAHYEKARLNYTEAKKIVKKANEKNPSPLLAKCYMHLGSVNLLLAKFNKAEKKFEKSKALYDQFPKTVASYKLRVNQARLYTEKDQKGKAKEILKSTKRDLLEAYGAKRHPIEAEINIQIGRLKPIGKNIKYFKESLDILSDIYKVAENKNYHPNTARIMNYIGYMYLETSGIKKAEKMFKTALDTFRVFYKPDHPDKAETLFYIGLLEKKKGNLIEARKNLRETIEMTNRILENEKDKEKVSRLATDSPLICKCLLELGKISESLGDIEDAIQYTKQSIESTDRIHNFKINEISILGYKRMAELHFKNDDLDKSLDFLEKVTDNKTLISTKEFISLIELEKNITKKTSPDNFKKLYELETSIVELLKSVNDTAGTDIMDILITDYIN
jgi:tetratricopeptide (TPR) repeat protein